MGSGWSLAKRFLYFAVPTFAVLVTWLTGFLGALYDHGLPLPWKRGGCPSVGLGACVGYSYDWIAFGLDVAIYIALGYCPLLLYSNYERAKHSGLGSRGLVEDTNRSPRRSHPFLVLSTLATIAVLATFITGFFVGHYEPMIGRFWFEWGHGFRLLWNEGCPPWSEMPCGVVVFYSLPGFVLDVLFYTVIGYGLLPFYSKYLAGFSEFLSKTRIRYRHEG